MFKLILLSVLSACVLAASPAIAAFKLESIEQDDSTFVQKPAEAYVTQSGKSLSEAVESIRRRGNVKRVISANTQIRGDREMHHIRVQTKDGKIKTEVVPGRKIK